VRFRHCRATVMEGKLHKSGLLFTLISTFAEREEIKGKRKTPNLLVEGWGFLFLKKRGKTINPIFLAKADFLFYPFSIIE